jgi:hypothetical protein
VGGTDQTDDDSIMYSRLTQSTRKEDSGGRQRQKNKLQKKEKEKQEDEQCFLYSTPANETTRAKRQQNPDMINLRSPSSEKPPETRTLHSIEQKRKEKYHTIPALGPGMWVWGQFPM